MKKEYFLYIAIAVLVIGIIYWVYPSRLALVKEVRWNLLNVSNDIDGDGIPNKWDNCPEKNDLKNNPMLCSEDFSIAANIIDDPEPKAGPFARLFRSKGFSINKRDGKKSDSPAYNVLIKSLSNYRNEQYIIRPRWDNINLKMTCNGNVVPKRCVLWDAIVLGCPEEKDPKIDVTKASNGELYETSLRLTDNFVFEKVDFGTKSSIACTIEGVYVTKGKKDPRQPIIGFSKNSNLSSHVCLGDDGRIHLTEVYQEIEPMRITLNR